jgi:hypothetical protein
MKLLVSEVLEKLDSLKTKEEKIDWLRTNHSPALIEVLKYIYNPSYKLFTTVIPSNYKPDMSPVGLSWSTLYNEHRKLYIFLESTKITPKRKTELLLQMLESIHPTESQLLCDIIAKKAKYAGVNLKFLGECFPGAF